MIGLPAFLSIALAAGGVAEAAGALPLCLLPLGPQPSAEDVAYLSRAVTAVLGLDVRTLPAEAMPTEAYYLPRKRYRAERLLDYLEGRCPSDARAILGVTAVDVSTTKGAYEDWGILGLGTLGGRTCVVSMFRCRRGARDAAHVRERFAKVAVHELGHVFGLPHCSTRGCLLEDAEGSVSTTDREYDLCARCRRDLRKEGLALPEAPTIPWPRPKTDR